MKKYLLLFASLFFLFLASCTEEADPDNTPIGEIDPTVVGLWTRYRLETYTSGAYTGGYLRQEYRFNADGTYQYLLKHYSVFSTPIIFLYESGKWGVSDNQLTLTIKPTKGQDQEWSKVNGSTSSWGSKLSTSARTLETITYNYGGKYWEGTNTVDLALNYTKETVRDGSFSDSSMHAWYYQSRDESMINLPPGFSW